MIKGIIIFFLQSLKICMISYEFLSFLIISNILNKSNPFIIFSINLLYIIVNPFIKFLRSKAPFLIIKNKFDLTPTAIIIIIYILEKILK